MTFSLSSKQSLLAGLRLKCPNCGEGKLLRAYLKQHDNCPNCQESFEEIRADDGPAWITILLTGHIIVPALFYLEKNHQLPLWQVAIILLTLACSSIYFILPRAKGLFIAWLWRLTKSQQTT